MRRIKIAPVFVVVAFVVLLGCFAYTTKRAGELEDRVKRLEFQVTVPSQRAFDEFHRIESKIHKVRGEITYHTWHHQRPDMFDLIPPKQTTPP